MISDDGQSLEPYFEKRTKISKFRSLLIRMRRSAASERVKRALPEFSEDTLPAGQFGTVKQAHYQPPTDSYNSLPKFCLRKPDGELFAEEIGKFF